MVGSRGVDDEPMKPAVGRRQRVEVLLRLAPAASLHDHAELRELRDFLVENLSSRRSRRRRAPASRGCGRCARSGSPTRQRPSRRHWGESQAGLRRLSRLSASRIGRATDAQFAGEFGLLQFHAGGKTPIENPATQFGIGAFGRRMRRAVCEHGTQVFCMASIGSALTGDRGGVRLQRGFTPDHIVYIIAAVRQLGEHDDRAAQRRVAIAGRGREPSRRHAPEVREAIAAGVLRAQRDNRGFWRVTLGAARQASVGSPPRSRRRRNWSRSCSTRSRRRRRRSPSATPMSSGLTALLDRQQELMERALSGGRARAEPANIGSRGASGGAQRAIAHPDRSRADRTGDARCGTLQGERSARSRDGQRRPGSTPKSPVRSKFRARQRALLDRLFAIAQAGLERFAASPRGGWFSRWRGPRGDPS